MKRLILVGGPMGVGKSAVCHALMERLSRCLYLDGDWCWNMRPFSVTEETRALVLDNICSVLARDLRCPELDHVIFGWVLHQQETIDTILSRLPLEAWGWHRYGVTVGLPAPGDDGFAEAYGAMQDRRAQIIGYYDVKSPFADADENPINLVEDRIARSVPSLDELFTVEGISGLLGALGTLNVGQLVASHYPDTYLAWMQTLDADQLAFG